jgi:hypothetical protein
VGGELVVVGGQPLAERLGARSTVATQAVVRPGTYPDGATLVGAPARVVEGRITAG